MVGLLDMVKVLSFALSEGKVAVHCHAGLGRTGKKKNFWAWPYVEKATPPPILSARGTRAFILLAFLFVCCLPFCRFLIIHVSTCQ